MSTYLVPVTINELDSILNIQQHCYSGAFLESRESFAEKLSISRHCLGLTNNGELIAYAIALPWTHLKELKLNSVGASESPSTDCLYIHDIAVLPRYRGNGFAELLMRRLAKHACLAGLSWIDLVAVQDSSPRWARMGFVSSDLSVGSYGVDSTAMTLPIRKSVNQFTYRAATSPDYPKILQLVKNIEAIEVSNEVRFYEPTELLDFIEDSDWIVGVAVDSSDEIVGFSTLHRMSWHWSLLDNFLVHPNKRRLGVGRDLYAWNELILGLWRTRYITTLVDPKDNVARSFLELRGWKSEKQYLWIDFHREGTGSR